MSAAPKLKRGTPEFREFLRTIGAKGGERTKAKMTQDNPDYFHNIGLKGYQTRVKNLGGIKAFRKVASEMGKKSGLRWQEEEL